MLESLEGKRGLPRHKPPVPVAGRAFRPADPDSQRRDRLTGCARSSSAAPIGSRARAGTAARAAELLGLGAGQAARASSSPRRGSRARQLIDEYCGGMADGHRFLGYLPGGACGGHPAGTPGRPAARLRHARAARLLHRLGGGHRPLRPRRPPRRRAQPDAVLRGRELRPVHPLPLRHRESSRTDGPARPGTSPSCASWPPAMRDASICGLGQAAPNPLLAVLEPFSGPISNRAGVTRSERPRTMSHSELTFELDGREVSGGARGDDLAGGAAAGDRDPAPVLPRPSRAIGPTATAGPAWSRSRASACWRRRASASRRRACGSQTRLRAGRRRAADGLRAARWPTSRRVPRPTTPIRSSGAGPRRWGWTRVASHGRHAPPPDRSHPAMAVQLDACIQCTLCVRACREVQVNDVIGMAGRGAAREDRLRLRRPDGPEHLRRLRRVRPGLSDRGLDARGRARRRRGTRPACPTGRSRASAPIAASAASSPSRSEDERLLAVEGRDGPANHNRLCVKGRFGFDYVHHPNRLTTPLIRKPGVPKHASDEVDPANPWTHFRAATWDEALDVAARGLVRIRDRDGNGRRALAGFGSAKGSNEEAYLFQKLVRIGFGSNNVDHCTRLCHASSVAALMETIGSGAVTAPFAACRPLRRDHRHRRQPDGQPPGRRDLHQERREAGCEAHRHRPPPAGALSRHATHHLAFRPGTDVALLNALIHTIIDEGLVNRDYVERTRWASTSCGRGSRASRPRPWPRSAASTRRRSATVARLYATSPASIIFWGMGISQHVHGTDNARCLIALALIDRPGRAAGHRAAPAARPEQRPGGVRRRPDPDGLPRLSLGRGRARPGSSSRSSGARRSTPSAA